MALRSVSRQASRWVAQVGASEAAPSVSFLAKRCMSLDGLRGYNEREAAQENVYFRREEEKALRKLLSRVKADAEKKMSDKDRKELRDDETSGIKSLINKYDISESDVDALINWKHHHH